METTRDETHIEEESRDRVGITGPTLALIAVSVILVCTLAAFGIYIMQQDMEARLIVNGSTTNENVRAVKEAVVSKGDENVRAIQSMRGDLMQALISENTMTRDAIHRGAERIENALARSMTEVRNGITNTGALIGEDGVKTRNRIVEMEGKEAAQTESMKSLEERLEQRITASSKATIDALTPAPPPLPTAEPEPPKTNDLAGLLALTRAAQNSAAAATGNYEVIPVGPGEKTEKYCYEDVIAGKIRISAGPGIKVRNYLSFWGREIIDLDAGSAGEYPVSKGAKDVSFYSPTNSFLVLKQKS